ncbi:MAG: C-GCAxxG-C-C family protein [Candidatus Marinimicrobia bacterium]|nr:C-GCAxxG-C-C family protein [Candidatus Neomarinimicrobiota bacterium]
MDPLAGGIYQQGYQCGMLWGSAMALGTEAYRRRDDQGEAIALAINATKHIAESFLTKSVSTECEEITDTDMTNKWSLAKYMLTGKMFGCFNLAAKWEPDAIAAAHEGLDIELPLNAKETKSCASEVIKKMGGTAEETVMVAGFAGGIGLRGSGCGALGAAMWKITLDLVRTGEWKYTLNSPTFDELIEKFYKASDYKMECSEICGKTFNSVGEHTEYINSGGCNNLINALAQS